MGLSWFLIRCVRTSKASYEKVIFPTAEIIYVKIMKFKSVQIYFYLLKNHVREDRKY